MGFWCIMGMQQVRRNIKAARWEEYQANGGKWDYDRWSNVYDANMLNAKGVMLQRTHIEINLAGVKER